MLKYEWTRPQNQASLTGFFGVKNIDSPTTTNINLNLLF